MCESNFESILNSKILANYFIELCKTFLPPNRESSMWMNQRKVEHNTNLILFLTQMRRLLEEKQVDIETFKSDIWNKLDINILRVEILWYLNYFEIMTLLEFVEYHEAKNNRDVIVNFAEQVFEHLLEINSTSELKKNMLVCFVKTVLECLERESEIQRSYYIEIQLSIIAENLKSLYANEDSCEGEKYFNITEFSALCSESMSDSTAIMSCVLRILLKLLEGPQHSLKLVLKKQETVKNNFANKKIFEFFKVVVMYCNLEFLINELQKVLINSILGINWSHLLCLITFLGTHFKDGWSNIKQLVNLILNMALQNLDVKLLSYVFLIARQGCYEKSSQVFPSYLQWFSSTFSAESKRPLCSKKICSFFFQYLTDLVPYDSTYYLKVHINRAPWVPPDCQSILHDYTELVKIQLTDLNVSTELGICENPTSKSAAVFDVERVLKHFHTNNEILNSVFQVAMFSRDYYEKKFLPELLSKFDGKKSVRHKVILKLHSLGKIPNSLFKMYKSLEKKSK